MTFFSTVLITMWYPTKLQWSLIWMTTVICLIGWLRTNPTPQAFILPGMLVAGLFYWHASTDPGRTGD